jgi:pyrimidine-nucleoside phosphorylase
LGKYFNPKHIKTIKAQSSGYINYLSTKTIGLISFKLGAGRLHKEDAIDYHAGIYLNKIKGEFVKKNDTIATLYSTNNINSSIVKEFVNNVLISQKPIQTKPIILKVIK